MKLSWTISAVALATALGMAGPVLAEDGAAVDFNLGVTSDYVFRGVSQTDEKAAVQGGVDVTYKSAYAGAWASNVDFGDSTEAEVDLYAGVRPELGGFTLDLGVIAYLYPGEPSSADWTYVEAKVGASRAVGPVTFGGAVYISPQFTGHTGQSLYSELNFAWKASDKVSVSGAFGHQDIEDADGYSTWNLGAAYAITDKVSVDARYWDTDEHGFGANYGSRAVISLKGVF